MFKAIDVWKRVDDKTLIRYRCFHILSTNRYCVQSADYYKLPIDEKTIKDHDKQFLELLFEDAPDTRAQTYQTLEEAIVRHDEDFKNFFERYYKKVWK